MTARDQYLYAVKCPKCGAQGTVQISEATAESHKPRGPMDRVFDAIPEPFEAASIQPIKFRCRTCDVEAT